MQDFDAGAWTIDQVETHKINDFVKTKTWEMPEKTIHFLCDLHADVDALKRSLEECGAAKINGFGPRDFKLTKEGKGALFIIGGDCLDKGPSNFDLLDGLAWLDAQAKGNMILLAGNHDVRTIIGLQSVNRFKDIDQEVETAHLFARMGKRAVPFLTEVFHKYNCKEDILLPGSSDQQEEFVKNLLFPDDSWYKKFPLAVAGFVPKKRIEKELRKIPEKIEEFMATCDSYDLSLIDLYYALNKARHLLSEPKDSNILSWFFHKMKLAHREGSFFFVHAGLDDYVAEMLHEYGEDVVNDHFMTKLHGDRKDQFSMYHSSVGNAMRTKYRDVDFPLTDKGIAALNDAGIQAIVHGHRNGFIGQRIVLREGMLNIECDCSVDRNTRAAQGIDTPGYAVTTISPQGMIFGRSADHDRIKLFVLKEEDSG